MTFNCMAASEFFRELFVEIIKCCVYPMELQSAIPSSNCSGNQMVLLGCYCGDIKCYKEALSQIVLKSKQLAAWMCLGFNEVSMELFKMKVQADTHLFCYIITQVSLINAKACLYSCNSHNILCQSIQVWKRLADLAK